MFSGLALKPTTTTTTKRGKEKERRRERLLMKKKRYKTASLQTQTPTVNKKKWRKVGVLLGANHKKCGKQTTKQTDEQ